MVVVDANLLVTIASGDARGDQVTEQIVEWLDDGVELHAPFLAQYEVINALTRLIVSGFLLADSLEDTWNTLSIIPIHYHPISRGKRIVEIALQLRRQTAYDAAYIALALELDTEVWTLDGPLYRNANPLGLPVRLLT